LFLSANAATFVQDNFFHPSAEPNATATKAGHTEPFQELDGGNDPIPIRIHHSEHGIQLLSDEADAKSAALQQIREVRKLASNPAIMMFGIPA
jgi:hypothetical protein